MELDYTITSEEVRVMREQLLEIGAKSMFIINASRPRKDEVWDRAIEINYIGQKLFKGLASIDNEKLD